MEAKWTGTISPYTYIDCLRRIVQAAWSASRRRGVKMRRRVQRAFRCRPRGRAKDRLSDSDADQLESGYWESKYSCITFLSWDNNLVTIWFYISLMCNLAWHAVIGPSHLTAPNATLRFCTCSLCEPFPGAPLGLPYHNAVSMRLSLRLDLLLPHWIYQAHYASNFPES